MNAQGKDQRQRLRELIAAPGVIQAAGTGDTLQALVAQSVGFPAVYLSGLLANYSHGYPDGALTMTEIATRVREMTARLDVPVIVDADEGFGGIPQLIRTVEELERAGASALHLEDLIVKKKGSPLPIEQAAARIRAAVDARRDDKLVVIARTDAMAPWRAGLADDWEGCDAEAFDRMCAYAEAGADVVLPLYPTIGWLAKYGPQVPKPILCLYGVNAPPKPRPELPGFDVRGASVVPARDLEVYNVKIVLNSVNIVERLFPAMEATYAEWLATGLSQASAADKQAKAKLSALVGTRRMDERASRYEV
jgi:2-methylisocitrate lyase-like PEP mutase family enzyme